MAPAVLRLMRAEARWTRGLFRAVLWPAVAGAALSACAPRRAPASAYPGGVVRHETEGLASWYGPGFAGRPTASGEEYDPNDLTAAHRTLPFGSRLLVSNLDNGRTVWVRVNDRGPFVDGRIVDLSRSAAEALAMVGPGTARVRLEVRPPGAIDGAIAAGRGPAPPPSLEVRWLVQVGAFGERENAEALARELAARGLQVRIDEDVAATVHRVRVGPFPERNVAEEAAAALGRDGVSGFLVAGEPAAAGGGIAGD